jgi:hypothetical protein
MTHLHPPILADASVSICAPLLTYLPVRSAAVLDTSLAWAVWPAYLRHLFWHEP